MSAFVAIEVSFLGDIFGFAVYVLGFGWVFGGGQVFVGFSSIFFNGNNLF